jgi:protein-tyrosine phosphatase
MQYIVAGDKVAHCIGHAGAMAADYDAGSPAMPAPRNPAGDYRICLVCLGNICRSPMAEVVLRDELDRAGLGERVTVESAGTGDWHVGGPMDPRARAELARRGYDGSRHIARQIGPSWLGDFDLIVVMDSKNLASVRQMAASRQDSNGDAGLAGGRIVLMRSFDPEAGPGAEVPDPYNGSRAEYEQAFELVQAAARGLVSRLAELLGDRTEPA